MDGGKEEQRGSLPKARFGGFLSCSDAVLNEAAQPPVSHYLQKGANVDGCR